MPRYHSSSASSGSSCNSAKSDGSARTYQTDITTYSHTSAQSKSAPSKALSPTNIAAQKASPRASVETYASTIDMRNSEDEDSDGTSPPLRFQCYEPDTSPATSKEFAAIFPSTRRLLIQHDETTEDGNMNLHIDTEVTTSSGRRKKLTLFHLRMKDLRERQFSLRRYCRDSGREVATCKKHYIKSAPSTPRSSLSRSATSLTNALHDLSIKQKLEGQDSGYNSAESSDDDEDVDKMMEDRLNLMTTPPEQVVSHPTDSIRIDFSNYAQVVMDRRREGHQRCYGFEYWGYDYVWKREKQIDDGETIYFYELIRKTDSQKLAIIMPDALSPQEAKWEAKQGGWIPASSMRLLRSDVSDDLGDVIMTTGLTALADDSIRRNFSGIDRRR